MDPRGGATWGLFTHPGHTGQEASTAYRRQQAFALFALQTENACRELWMSIGTDRIQFRESVETSTALDARFLTFKSAVWAKVKVGLNKDWSEGTDKFGWHVLYGKLEGLRAEILSGTCRTRDRFCLELCVR